LEIPDFGTDVTLPSRALPSFGDLAMQFVLTPSGWPRLTANDPEAWGDNVLARALEVVDPQALFEADGSGLKYLHRFLNNQPRLEASAQIALLRILRVIFSSIRTGLLDEHRDVLTQIVARIPARFRRSLPLGGNWPEETRRNVCASGSTVLFLPPGFETEVDLGTAAIPADDAIAILRLVAAAMSTGRNTNPAAAVIRAAGSPTEVMEATAGLRLWATQRLSGERTESVVCTLEEFRASRIRSTLFVGPANDWLRELAAGLAQELTVVPPDSAVAIFPTDGLPAGDLPGVLALLTEGPPLGGVTDRVPLLRRLIRQHPSDVLVGQWSWAVRYLLHGTADLPIDDDLYIASGSKGIWARLAQTALESLDQANRILPDNELSRLLNPDNRTALRIKDLDPNGVAGLLREVDLETLSVQFSPDERDEVIRGLQQHLDLILRLPLHDRLDGRMTRITQKCYWESSATPGTLAQYVTLLRFCNDPVLAAIQRSAHPPELTPVELVRLALRICPAAHTEAILGAFANYRSLAPEQRKQFADLRDQLAKAKWLLRHTGGHVAPGDVLHDDKLGDAVLEAIRIVPPLPDDPVPSADLSAAVREHSGFGELTRQLFPSREQLVSRLAKVLTRDTRFRIGNLDLRTEEERDEWLDAFRDAPVNVMAARNLVSLVDSIESELCVNRLLPPLRDGTISTDRLERILAFLRDRHERGLGERPAILRIYNGYLKLAATNCDAIKSLLPRLRLLSEAGAWADPATLCIATGLDRACTLDGEQAGLLEGCVCRQPVLRDVLREKAVDHEADFRITDRHFTDSVQTLREYFENWRNSEEVAGWAGCLLSLLGDYKPMRALADEFLEIASPGRTAAYIRTKAGMRDAQRLTLGATSSESPSEMMTQQRVLVRVTDPSRPMEVTNLLGARITVKALDRFDTLLIGFGLDRIDARHLAGLHVRCLHLRKINPVDVRPTLRELVAQTGQLILRVFFGQHESQLEFASVLDEFSGDDAFGVRVAQESFLNGAQYSLRFLGLSGTRNERLRELLELADLATNRRSEESAIMATDLTRSLPGRTASSLEKEFREVLQTQITRDGEVQAELVAAVRRKVSEFRYEPRSVLFELFQNADDAYAECNSPIDASSVFVIEQTAHGLAVFHNGRPINRSGDTDASAHRHDLRKMLSLGHSDKGVGPAPGNVTGHFGLGFKSVFLLTDCPRVVSGRLAFEVLGGVYPREMEHRLAEKLRNRIKLIGLPPERATIFEIPTRMEVDPEDALEPFRRLAHLLVVFARRIRSIRCGPGPTSWTERTVVETSHARVVTGSLRPVGEPDEAPREAVIIRCGKLGDVLLGLNESGFASVPTALPSIWVTAPTTEKHGLGYLVNAPLDLDVGRSQVTWDAPANAERLRELGSAAGDALIALCDAGLGALKIPTDEDRIWRSLWEVLARPGQRREIHENLMWGESGAAQRLYVHRPVLPTGIDAGAHSALTSIPKLGYVLGGILDKPENKRFLAQVVSWPGFARYPSGSVVSDQAVWSRLHTMLESQHPEPIDLATVVGNELHDSPNIDPDRATRFGAVISRDLLRGMESGTPLQQNEHKRLLFHLRNDNRFRSRTSARTPSDQLLIPRNYGDLREEAMRAAFAPPERVLADAYDNTGIDFFLACRGQLIAPLAEMARWALAADTESRRIAVLTYLREGEQQYRLQSELHRMGIAGTWLAHIQPEELRVAGYDDREQTATLVTLGVIPADLAVPPPPPRASPNYVFAQIADWWRTHALNRTRRYNHRVYPDGRLPQLSADGPGSDVASRVEWLKLFVTGIVQTIGRVTDDQNRTFVRLCETERWLATLTDSVHGPRQWLAAVEGYIDRHHADGIRYFFWLRHFIDIATVGRHLDAYADSFLAIDRFDGRPSPRHWLTTRTSPQFQFGGPDAPTLVPILGIGSCFVLRELVRIRLVTREDVYPYCYAPVRQLRQFLERLGWQDDEDRTVHDRSHSIYDFLAEHHSNDPTFGNAFDIPLLMYAEEHPEDIE
jgi:hypothetical protein